MQELKAFIGILVQVTGT